MKWWDNHEQREPWLCYLCDCDDWDRPPYPLTCSWGYVESTWEGFWSHPCPVCRSVAQCCPAQTHTGSEGKEKKNEINKRCKVSLSGASGRVSEKKLHSDREHHSNNPDFREKKCQVFFFGGGWSTQDQKTLFAAAALHSEIAASVAGLKKVVCNIWEHEWRGLRDQAHT